MIRGATMKLKPCPFCGGRAHLNNEVDIPNTHYYSEIVCEDCCARSIATKTNDQAISAWNKRVK